MAANIDVGKTLDEFEYLLQKQQESVERQRALGILQRWSRDPDLNDQSRQRATALLNSYAPHLLL